MRAMIRRHSNRPAVRFVSYCTEGAYERIASRYLLASAETWGVPVYCQAVPAFADWRTATAFKPAVVRSMCEAYPEEAIVWLDADCELTRDPTDFFAELATRVDVSARLVAHTCLNSAVVLFSPSPLRPEVIDGWAACIPQFKGDPCAEQMGLHAAMLPLVKRGLRFEGLPVAYMTDAHPDKVARRVDTESAFNPAILHHYAGTAAVAAIQATRVD